MLTFKDFANIPVNDTPENRALMGPESQSLIKRRSDLNKELKAHGVKLFSMRAYSELAIFMNRTSI